MKNDKGDIIPFLYDKRNGTDVGKEKEYWTRAQRLQWIVTLFIGCSILYAARTILPVCIPSMSTEFDWTKTESGTVLSAFFWGYCLTQILGGYLSDNIGGESVLTVAAIGWSFITIVTPNLAYIFTSKKLTLYLQVLARVLLGAFQGLHYPSLSSLVAERCHEKERSFTFAAVTSGSHIGTMMSGSVGSYLKQHYNWHLPFRFIGLSAVFWLLFMKFYMVARQNFKTKTFSLRNLFTKSSTASSDSPPVPWRLIFTSPPFWALVAGHFMHTLSFFVIINWMPTFFEETYKDEQGLVFNVVPYLVSIPSGLCGGAVADRLIAKGYNKTKIRKLMEGLSLLGTATFLYLVCKTNSFTGALICMAGAVGSCGLHVSGILVNPQDLFPKYAGSVFGIMNTAGAFGAFFGTYFAGYILDTTQSWAIVFDCTGVACITGLIIYTCFGSAQEIIT